VQPAAEEHGDDRAVAQIFSVVMSVAFSSALACFWESRLPIRTPIGLALFTRWMPAPSSGVSRPLTLSSNLSQLSRQATG